MPALTLGSTRPVSGRSGQHDAEGEHERERPDEIGNGEQEPVGRVDDRLEPRPPRHRANDRDRAAHDHREFERRRRELERRGKPLAEERENVAVQRDRGSEVATQRIAHPDGELRQEAAVEPVMRSERRDVRLACARRDHHRDGIAGHDPQENEHDDRDARERGERHQKTPEDRKRDHRFVTTSPNRGHGRPAPRPIARPAAQVAGETSVGCKAPDLFGMTLRSDL